MPNTYLRVPRQVAAYYRHRIQGKTLPPSAAITFDNTSVIYKALCISLFSNNASVVVGGCVFCERQWRAMLKKHKVDSNTWPTDKDVAQMAGIQMHPDANRYEYICIALPTEVFRHDVLVKTNGQWQLTSGGAVKLRQLLLEEMMTDMFDFCENAYIQCKENNQIYSSEEARHLFMQLHGMSIEDEAAIVESIRFGYKDYRKAYQFLKYDCVEFGD